MIKLRVDDETAIPLSVDSSSAVSMTVSEAFIDRGGSAIQNNKNATPSTSQVVVTPDQGFDGMAKVTVEAMPQGALSPIDIDFDTNTGAFTAEARVGTSGYLADTEMVGGGFQLDTQAADTITPSTMQRQAVAAHKWTTGAVMVGAIPPEYIIPTGTKSISANGTGIDVKAYEKVDVAVPGITPSGTLAIATNGSHDVTNYATASVAVPASAVDTGTKNITANGNGQDVVGYAAVNVNVPNSYAAADEGKVVQSGALVSQSSATYTENGTYDTTLKNEVVVDVQSGGGDPNENLIKANNNTLASFSDPNLTYIRAYLFYNCSSLKSIDLPSLTKIGADGFRGCDLIGDLSFENYLSSLVTNAFRANTHMTSITFKKGINRVDAAVFQECSNLAVVDIGDWGSANILNINGSTGFYYTPNITALILRGGAVFPLASLFSANSALSSTAIIYVPESLVATYQAATNWSTYASRIVKIEGTQYENYYADGSPVT